MKDIIIFQSAKLRTEKDKVKYVQDIAIGFVANFFKSTCSNNEIEPVSLYDMTYGMLLGVVGSMSVSLGLSAEHMALMGKDLHAKLWIELCRWAVAHGRTDFVITDKDEDGKEGTEE